MATVEMPRVKSCKATEFMRGMCKFFAILPSGKFSRLYPICFISLELCAFSYTSYEKNVNIMGEAPWTIRLMSVLNDVSVYGSVLVCTIRNNFEQRSELISFADKCADLHQINFGGALVVMNVLFWSYAGTNWYNVWSTYEFWPGLFFAFRDVINYQVGCLYLLLTYYALLLKTQLAILSDSFNGQSVTAARPDQFLRASAKEYLHLSVLVKAYSSIFGVDYLLLSVNLVINCLTPLNILYKYSIMSDANRGAGLIALTVLWILFPIIYMWIIIKPCNDVTQKALEIANKCNELEYVDGVDDETKGKLQELSKKIVASPPVVSASNCFPVNHGLASSIVTAVATYFIVLVQCNQQA